MIVMMMMMMMIMMTMSVILFLRSFQWSLVGCLESKIWERNVDVD